MDFRLFPGENEKERLKKTLRSLGVAFLVCRLSWLGHIIDLMHGVQWSWYRLDIREDQPYETA